MRRMFISRKRTTEDSAVLYATERSERELNRQRAAQVVSTPTGGASLPMFGLR